MPTAYDRSDTALLFIDPYNDFLSPEGKLWPMVSAVAAAQDLLTHLRQIMAAVRAAGVQVFIVPHHQFVAGDCTTWHNASPYQQATAAARPFEKGSWGAQWAPGFAPQPGDIVVHEHWGQSGFANTDLDMLLKQHGIRKVILIGLIANTCVESTGRFAMELGYQVTLVKDATAAAGPEMLHAAHVLNGPTFATAILTTAELLALLPAPETASHPASKE
jgi:nicotinamidase-related amidase